MIRRPSQQTPFHEALRVCHQMRWQWQSPFTFELPSPQQAGGHITLNFETQPWPAIAHHIREGCRHHLLSKPELAKRWDMKGIEVGIDFKLTRHLCSGSSLSFLQRGILRTIISGALWTPSRMLAGGRLSEEQAACVHCDAGVVESTGHRYWQCPRWHEIRSSLGLVDFPHQLHPRCTTRCGIFVQGTPLAKHTCYKVQKMMVFINEAAMNSPAAQRQYAQARRIQTNQRADASYQSLADAFNH